MLFAPKIAFVDVETTGASPTQARVTEVGIVTVSGPREAPSVETWSSLVNPGVAIPPEIRFLTGITDAMVRDAPSFAAIAPEVLARLEDAVFVAHHARFDYGFIRQELSRAGVAFHARTLCTVRLSRLLFPDRSPHTLDAIIARLRLPVVDRHRALGDARVLWEFVQTLYRRFPAQDVEAAVRKLLRHPNLPAHLPPDALERLPAAPGVYAFFGLNDHPLYIGSSTDLRDRVAAHFCGDHRSERGVRLASETRRIEWERTAGEVGARLLEADWIRTRMPAHNVALRKRPAAMFAALDPASSAIRWLPADSLDDGARDGSLGGTRGRPDGAADPSGRDAVAPGHGTLYGPFASRAAGRAAIRALARERELCEIALGLERGRAGAGCFRRQLGRCLGACVGDEPGDALARRSADAFAPLAFPAWPFDGAVALVECDPDNRREDWIVFDRWRHLGTVGSHDAALALARTGAAPPFERATFTIARTALERACARLVGL